MVVFLFLCLLVYNSIKLFISFGLFMQQLLSLAIIPWQSPCLFAGAVPKPGSLLAIGHIANVGFV